MKKIHYHKEKNKNPDYKSHSSLIRYSVFLSMLLLLSVFALNYSQQKMTNAFAQTAINNNSLALPNHDAKSTAIQYWTTLSQGNANKTTSFYLGNATLNWIGGPLNGKYTGSEQIHTVWSKFFKAWSSVKPKISNVQDTKGMNDITNVTAKVIFDNVNAISGKNATIPVNYQVYMKQLDGKFLIQNAIFKIMKKP